MATLWTKELVSILLLLFRIVPNFFMAFWSLRVILVFKHLPSQSHSLELLVGIVLVLASFFGRGLVSPTHDILFCFLILSISSISPHFHLYSWLLSLKSYYFLYITTLDC